MARTSVSTFLFSLPVLSALVLLPLVACDSEEDENANDTSGDGTGAADGDDSDRLQSARDALGDLQDGQVHSTRSNNEAHFTSPSSSQG